MPGHVPPKGTPEYDLWVAGIEIAAAAPLRQGKNVYSAQVPWHEIGRLRAALDALGLDWRGVKAENEQARREAS